MEFVPSYKRPIPGSRYNLPPRPNDRSSRSLGSESKVGGYSVKTTTVTRSPVRLAPRSPEPTNRYSKPTNRSSKSELLSRTMTPVRTLRQHLEKVGESLPDICTSVFCLTTNLNYHAEKIGDSFPDLITPVTPRLQYAASFLPSTSPLSPRYGSTRRPVSATSSPR